MALFQGIQIEIETTEKWHFKNYCENYQEQQYLQTTTKLYTLNILPDLLSVLPTLKNNCADILINFYHGQHDKNELIFDDIEENIRNEIENNISSFGIEKESECESDICASSFYLIIVSMKCF